MATSGTCEPRVCVPAKSGFVGKIRVKLFCLQDGHEICFVGDEAFRELSQVDPKADDLLNEVGSESLFLSSDITPKHSTVLLKCAGQAAL